MLVLGLESTCDETAAAVVKDGKGILSSVISSQIDLHTTFGGVVPELACRRHVEVIIPVIDEALSKAGVTLKEIDLIAVAHGPGLIGALLIGVNAAKTLALSLNKPFIGVNHIEAHLYAALMSHKEQPTFPSIGVILSGGHTSLLKMEDIGKHQLISQTVDDAVGECFDKVAKIMDLPYPGGPIIEKLAQSGNDQAYTFKGGKVKGSPLDFSFSGLKTAVLYAIKGQNEKNKAWTLSEQEKCDIAASFQRAAFIDIVNKTLLAAEQENCKSLIFGGGVTNNQQLRKKFLEAAPHLQQWWPSFGLSLDNAAMIAGLGYHNFLQRNRQGDDLSLEAVTRFS